VIRARSTTGGRLGLALRCIARALAALEPRYDWGAYGWERLDGNGEGEGRHIQLEWLGLKISVVVGRRPRKVYPDGDVCRDRVPVT